jgi:hypothetical protein
MRNIHVAASAAFITILHTTTALAASDKDIEALRADIHSMRQSYEGRIAELETKLSQMEAQKAAKPAAAPSPIAASTGTRNVYDNSFNPSIGVILNGKYSSFSGRNSNIPGFAVGEEGARGKEGFAIDESELNFASNVDDKFFGSLTASIVREDGEDKIELEEAFVQTLPGMGLPTGLNVKAGRAFWTLGYLNEHHSHADDFADRPLPYRIFLNNNFNDDGVEVSYILPTDWYSEIGGGAFRGDDFPFGNARGSSVGAWSAFGRVGGDIGEDQAWRVGAYLLSGNATDRLSNEDAVSFTGDSRLYAADLRYTWAPTGNAHEQEVILQGEYFWRHEDGTFDDTVLGTGPIDFDGHSSGWYAQTVYKFLPQWRVGYRYGRLESPDVPTGLTGSLLDSLGNNPDTHSLMTDWTNSEFSRIRLQFNREALAQDQKDNQFLVQYIMSIGAHGAHKY